EARKHNLPLIVHATGLAEAKVALRAGANVLVHSVQDLPVDQEFIDLAKKNGTILIPTLTVVDGYVRMFRGAGDRKAPAVDDPNGCVDRGTLAKVAESDCRSVAGSCRSDCRSRATRRADRSDGERESESARQRRHPDLHRHRRRQSADPSRPG